jgi:sporulation protein YqfC
MFESIGMLTIDLYSAGVALVGRRGKMMRINSLQDRLKTRMAEMLELPEDIVLNIPRIRIVGNNEVLVENHEGVQDYSPQCIRIRTPQGDLAVTGSCLIIKYIASDDVLIKGFIEKVEFDSWGGK